MLKATGKARADADKVGFIEGVSSFLPKYKICFGNKKVEIQIFPNITTNNYINMMSGETSGWKVL
jgi:hypothetical protein